MNRTVVSVGAVLALVGVALGCKSKEDQKPDKEHDVAPLVETIDDDAVAVLKRAVTLLRDTDTFSVTADTGFDVVQTNGQKIEFGSIREAVISRPNRARFETQRRDGKRAVVVFDGNDIWVYSPTHEIYARTSQPGNLDDSIAFLIHELGITVPLSDLYTSDVGAELGADLRSCFIVGDSSVAGVVCDQVAARSSYADFQIWISKSDQPLIQRIVISYREEPGQPQFRADFRDWNMAPKPPSSTFIFQPPAGTERIRFADIQMQDEE